MIGRILQIECFADDQAQGFCIQLDIGLNDLDLLANLDIVAALGCNFAGAGRDSRHHAVCIDSGDRRIAADIFNGGSGILGEHDVGRGLSANSQLRVLNRKFKCVRHVIDGELNAFRRAVNGCRNRAAALSHGDDSAAFIHRGDGRVGGGKGDAVRRRVNADLSRLAHVQFICIQFNRKRLRVKRRGHERIADSHFRIIDQHIQHRARRDLLAHDGHRRLAFSDCGHHAVLVHADHAGGLNAIADRARHAVRKFNHDGRGLADGQLELIVEQAHGNRVGRSCILRFSPVLRLRIARSRHRRVVYRFRRLAAELQLRLIFDGFAVSLLYGIIISIGFPAFDGFGFIFTFIRLRGALLIADFILCLRGIRRILLNREDGQPHQRIFRVVLIADGLGDAVLECIDLILGHRAQGIRIHPAFTDSAVAIKGHAQAVLGGGHAFRNQHNAILFKPCNRDFISAALSKERRIRDQLCIAEIELRRSSRRRAVINAVEGSRFAFPLFRRILFLFAAQLQLGLRVGSLRSSLVAARSALVLVLNHGVLSESHRSIAQCRRAQQAQAHQNGKQAIEFFHVNLHQSPLPPMRQILPIHAHYITHRASVNRARNNFAIYSQCFNAHGRNYSFNYGENVSNPWHADPAQKKEPNRFGSLERRWITSSS